MRTMRDRFSISKNGLEGFLRQAGAAGVALLFLAALSLLQADQSIQVVALTNSTDFQPALPQKGSLASIFCTGLEGGPSIVTALPQYPLPTEIVTGGLSIRVSINFTPAPILAIAFEQGYQQINVQVPWEVPEEPLFVQVFQGSNSAYVVDPNPWLDFPFANPAAFRWSVFFVDSQGYAIVQHASNYSQVTRQNPAVPGEFLVAYGINLGPVDNAPATGYPAPFNPLASSQVPQDACMSSDIVTIGTATVIPAYVGLAPGIVGVYQVNLQVPANVSTGDQQLVFGRNFLISPFGVCYGSGLGEGGVNFTSRSALLPVE